MAGFRRATCLALTAALLTTCFPKEGATITRRLLTSPHPRDGAICRCVSLAQAVCRKVCTTPAAVARRLLYPSPSLRSLAKTVRFLAPGWFVDRSATICDQHASHSASATAPNVPRWASISSRHQAALHTPPHLPPPLHTSPVSVIHCWCTACVLLDNYNRTSNYRNQCCRAVWRASRPTLSRHKKKCDASYAVVRQRLGNL